MRISLTINYDIPDDTLITDVTPNIEANNISRFKGGKYNATLQSKSKGRNVFTLGASKLGLFDTYANEYEGFMARGLTNTDGTTNGFKTIIKGKSIYGFTISFDMIADQYATSITVTPKGSRSQTFVNKGYEFVFSTNDLSVFYDEYEVTFNTWNKGKGTIRIVALTVTMSIEYTRRNGLMELTRGSQIVSDNLKPIYSVIGQYGEVTLLDKTGILEEQAEKQLLYNNRSVLVKLDDNIIGSYLSDTMEYQGSNKSVKITLIDPIQKWQDKTCSISLDENATALTLLYRLLAVGGDEYAYQISREVMDYLATIKLGNISVKNGSLWEQWNKLCVISQCSVYTKPNGYITMERYL